MCLYSVPDCQVSSLSSGRMHESCGQAARKPEKLVHSECGEGGSEPCWRWRWLGSLPRGSEQPPSSHVHALIRQPKPVIVICSVSEPQLAWADRLVRGALNMFCFWSSCSVFQSLSGWRWDRWREVQKASKRTGRWGLSSCQAGPGEVSTARSPLFVSLPG